MKSAIPWLLFSSSIVLAETSAETHSLGEMLVQALKPSLSDQIHSDEARDLSRNDLAETLNLIPGVSLQKTGARSESGITLRGYDLRQVPVFIDGIPVYVPYDGYPDLARFSVPESSRIEVAKSISPVLSGPNALGGLVNIYTARPTKPLEVMLHAGAYSGHGFDGGLRAAGSQEKAYWQFDVSWREQDYFPISSDYQAVPREDGNHRENSWSEDWRTSGRLAYTPFLEDEYTFGFWIQRGQKGTPPYIGDDPTIRARYWQWPQWDKNTLYFLTKTSLGSRTFLETKVHYDRFENTLKAFDNDTYTTQNLASSFTSFYDDWTTGASARLDHHLLKDTRISTAWHYKLDHHEEMNLGAERYTFEDQTHSLGIEMEHLLPFRNTLTAGMSHDWRKVNEAIDTNTGANLGGETVSSWNPQLVLAHDFNDDLNLHLGVSQKSRFPTIKDRYSYRMGQAIPNPDLEPESAIHLDFGIDGKTFDSRMDWSVGAYYSRVRDAIQRVDRVAFTPSGTGLFQLQNVGTIEHAGAELSTHIQWTDTIQSGVRYAYQHSENRTDSEIYVTHSPKHEVLLFSKFQLHEKFRIIPSFTWSDRRYVTSAGKEIGTYSKVDLKSETTLFPGVTLGAGVSNLFDRNQEFDEGFPEAGRIHFVDLRYEF